jgi:hypothetical protein
MCKKVDNRWQSESKGQEAQAILVLVLSLPLRAISRSLQDVNFIDRDREMECAYDTFRSRQFRSNRVRSLEEHTP